MVFYKYLSDSFLIKVYDLIYDEKPENLKVALEAYKEALEDEESAKELKEQIKAEFHYVIEPELTYTCFADAARNNVFNREQLQKAFNNIEQSDPLFADLFTDIDLYSNRLGAGDQKQSDTISNLIKEIDKADLLNSDEDVLGNAYEYLIGQFASETGKKAGEFYTPQAVSKILTKIAISGQENKRGLSVYDPCMGSGSLLLNAKKYAKEPGYIKYYGHVGHTAVIPEEYDNSAAHALITFRNPMEEIEPYFLNYQFQTFSSKKKIDNITTGNTIKHILASDMQEFVINVPDVDEQKRIAKYFLQLDHLITLHQRKAEMLKNIKKFMLQKMFV